MRHGRKRKSGTQTRAAGFRCGGIRGSLQGMDNHFYIPWRALAAVLACAALAACSSGGDSTVDGTDATDDGAETADDGTPPPDADVPADLSAEAEAEADVDEDGLAPGVLHEYTASDEVLLNPERGFHRLVLINEETDLGWVRDEGFVLVQGSSHLDTVRTAPITADLLAGLQRGLDAVRAAGLKIVLRFVYNDGFDEDAPLAWVLQHIEQLTPTLQANADVILVLQAGFIGAWGEWHSSTNHLLDDVATQRAILDAELAALPPDRMVQLRTPLLKAGMFGSTPLAASDAFGGSAAARVGHHNDCFLASDTDMGTYPDGEIEVWKAYLADETRFLPMGGETCAPNPPRSECASALAEMARLHVTYMHQGYHPEVVASWTTGGCRAEIDRRIGYRFVLESAEFPSTARPGQAFRLRLALRNDGWAAMFNPRPVVLVLDGAGRRVELPLAAADPRLWAPGSPTSVEAVLRLPDDVPAGSYRVLLWLPDAAASLRDRNEYAVRLAADAMWDEPLAANLLGTLDVD
jgi:hypothetical protein